MQYLYLLREGDSYYKVGISSNVKSRVSQLQAHIPNKIEIICTKFLDTKAYNAEQELHAWLSDYRTTGANEWFKLDAEKALELCTRINQYPDIDISDRVTLAIITQHVKRNQRIIENKLDKVINVYQRDIRKTIKESSSVAKPKLSIPPIPIPFKVTKQQLDQELFERAINLVREKKSASVSMLQRHLKIGYGRAARVIEQMEDQGIVGAADGIRPRTVF